MDLNQEIQKLRQQNAQLKQLVIEERNKNQMLEKKQLEIMNAHSQEVERSQFDIQRLTKRISILQEELAKEQPNASKSPSNPNTPTNPRSSSSSFFSPFAKSNQGATNTSVNNSNVLPVSSNQSQRGSQQKEDELNILRLELTKKIEENSNPPIT